MGNIWENCGDHRDTQTAGVGVGGGEDTRSIARVALTFFKVCPVSPLCNNVDIIFLLILSIGSCLCSAEYNVVLMDHRGPQYLFHVEVVFAQQNNSI